MSQDLRFVRDIEWFDPNRDEMNIEEISIFESLPLEDYLLGVMSSYFTSRRACAWIFMKIVFWMMIRMISTDFDVISDDLPDVTDVTSRHHQKSYHQSKITSSPKIITKVDFSLLLQKRSLDGGRSGCPEALSTTNPPGFEQYQKPCVEGGMSDIQCVPGTE